jgi:3-methyl-2-oxobutanoate hydroxymethyltransferase
VEAAGAFALLLELVQADTARRITAQVQIPTVGIGSGKECDGQVLVIHDLIGLFPWFTPKFVKPKTQVGSAISEAATAFIQEVKAHTTAQSHKDGGGMAS